MRRSSAVTAATLGTVTGAIAGCNLVTLASATPPSIEVQHVELRGVGFLDASLGMALCVTNPNSAELDFRRITMGVDVAGTPLGESASETEVRLPPHSSTVVPFAVTVTERNLGPQVLGVLRTGGVDYRLHGTVQLTGALSLTVPFSRSGRLDLLTAGQDVLADTTASSSRTRCGTTFAA